MRHSLLAFCHFQDRVVKVVDVAGLEEFGRVFTNCQGIEMRSAAFDLRALLIAQVIGKETALGFHHELQALRAVFFAQNCPIGVVGSERRWHLEPAGQLGIDFHRLVLF